MSLALGLVVVTGVLLLGIVLIILGSQGLLSEHNKKNQTTILPSIDCGLPDIPSSIDNLERFKRIIKGEDAIPNSYPWMVSFRPSRLPNVHFCGGSLIYSDIVLTAAHCVYSFKPGDIIVAVGLHNRSENLAESNTFNVSKIKHHEFYSTFTQSNDIALVKLSKPVKFSKKVSTICLPKSKNEFNTIYDKNVTLIGWGSTDGINSQESLSINLKQTVLNIYSDQNECKKKFPYFNINEMYCGIDVDSHISNICYGDSGGPLSYRLNKKWTLFGITSLVLTENGTQKCDPFKPTYYTSTASYLDWIFRNIQNLK